MITVALAIFTSLTSIPGPLTARVVSVVKFAPVNVTGMVDPARNEHAFGPVVDSGDQSVVVTVDVEYGPAPYYLRMSEIMLRVSQRIPVCPLGNSVPVHKRDQCIWMPLGESKKGRFADHPHIISLQNVNANVHSCCNFEVRYSNCWWLR